MFELRPEILAEGALRFQARAAFMIVQCMIGGLLIVGGAGFVAFRFLGAGGAPRPGLLAYIPPVAYLAGIPLGLAIGYAVGRERAFALTLRAHELLALKAIDARTRALEARAAGQNDPSPMGGSGETP